MASSHPITTTPSAKTVVLTSSGGERFEVQLQAALQSETITHMIADKGFSREIVLSFPNISGETMSKVVEYCNKHVHYEGNTTAVDDMRAFDTQFVDVVDQKMLFDIIQASHYLNIKSLLDLTCQKVADMIRGKSPEEIRMTFNIKDDFTPEEKEEVRRENAANYLNIKSLLDLIMEKMNDMIKGKTPEEFFKSFSNKNHFTPEEEEETHKENTGPLSKDPGS